jgi:transposase InsO family protein
MTMNALFEAAGISRQAFYDWIRPSDRELARTPKSTVLQMAEQIRLKFLPGSSAREVYFFIRNKHPKFNDLLFGWGKHSFEKLCLNNGMRVEFRRFVPKTTVRGDYIFPNLIEGLTISDFNQVWVSDICYIFGSHGKLVGYATTLIDLYGRKLLGLTFSKTMHAAVTSQEIIRQAFLERKKRHFDGLIFHSDGGKQYIEKIFLAQLTDKHIDSSMAESCYHNAFAESFNDILKNHMMHKLIINSFSQLKQHEQFLKNCYNCYRPHGSLHKMTPNEFEQHSLTLQPNQRTSFKIKVISIK